MSCGVMRMNCLSSVALAVSICLSAVEHSRTYKELHRLITIDVVHEDIKFVQAPDRTLSSLPQSQQQTDGGKRTLASRKRLD